MKLDARQVAGFLRDPGATRLALIFGEDEGLIRERAQALTKRVAGSQNDPFLVAELTRDGWGRLPAEMAALSMIGGRRVVLVRDATDAVLSHVVEAMRTPGTAMMILEAPGLPKGKLRSFVEASADGVALACYVEEGRAAGALIRGALAEYQVAADDDAVEWLVQNLEPGRLPVRGETEKLALFVGRQGRVTLEDAQACVIGQGGGGDALVAAALGRWAEADRAVESAIADGLGGVGFLRIALSMLQRLHQAKLRVAAGASPSEVVRAMRPPVFHRAMPAIIAALGVWSADALLRCIEEARRVELECKQTASRPDLLARRFVADVVRLSRSQQGRPSTRGGD